MGKPGPTHDAAPAYEFRCMASVKDLAPAKKTNQSAGSCGAFQPLFSANGTDGKNGDAQEQAARIEQARCRGAQNGLEAGREEACRLARSGLSPSLKALIHALNDLSTSNQRMKEQVSAKVLELALSISERVTGENARLTLPAMSDLKALLEEALYNINRITLHINPEDARNIEALLAADGMQWPSLAQIDIQSDALMTPGEVRVSDQTGLSRESLDKRVLSGLAELLAKNNPAPN
jgi:flagellar biosynthesis/type III secretory pathway protein FliH